MIDLDHVQVRDPWRHPLREHPRTAAHLEDHIVVMELGQALDDAEDVAIDEEVLPELALAGARPRRAHHPNTSSALRSRAASSSG